MHGDDDVWFQQADDFGGFDGCQAAAAADRNKGNMHWSKCFHFGLRGHPVEVTQVQHVNAVEIEKIKGIADFIDIFFGMPVGLDAGDKDAANLKLSGSIDEMRITFYCRGKIMAGRIMADGDDISLQL